MSSTRWFPLDPVTRTQPIPADAFARFLLVLRSSICIQFSYPDGTETEPSAQTGNMEKEPETVGDKTGLPPLPPRPTVVISQMDTSEDAGNSIQREVLVSKDYTETVAVPSSSAAIVPKLDSPPPLPPSNQVPPPLPSRGHHPHVRPPLVAAASAPTILGKLSKLFLGSTPSNSTYSHSSLSTQQDSWFQEIYHSTHNHLPQMSALYHAFRAHGYANVASELPYLSNFVYLYVPGLYSGRNPFSNRAAGGSNNGEGKLTKHQTRVNELKALGLDTRMIIVPNDGTVYSNARLISDTVQQTFAETGKHIVLIGYSKGGVDSAAAISMTPAIVPMIRCFITLFSPLHGSHIATDIEDSVLRPVVYLGIKNLLDADTAAMKDLSMSARANFIFAYPFNEAVPSLSLASTVGSFSKNSSFARPYKYLFSNYHKENDGLVACQDAIYPGAEVILISGMDHAGPRPEHPIYRDHVSFILSVIQTALNSTRFKWNADEDSGATVFENLVLPDHVPFSDNTVELSEDPVEENLVSESSMAVNDDDQMIVTQETGEIPNPGPAIPTDTGQFPPA